VSVQNPGKKNIRWELWGRHDTGLDAKGTKNKTRRKKQEAQTTKKRISAAKEVD